VDPVPPAIPGFGSPGSDWPRFLGCGRICERACGPWSTGEIVPWIAKPGDFEWDGDEAWDEWLV
jgi:hypothetical protein